VSDKAGKLAKKCIWIKDRLPELMVLLVCMLLLGFGVSRKEGYHMDEMLSFELANAEFNPWIVPTQPEGRLAKFVHNELEGDSLGETLQNIVDTVTDVLENRGNSKLLSYEADVYEEPVWITSEQFEDYITVDEGDAFHYLSVYFNVKDDNHPPLHFMLLHTMSSLFRGEVNPWIGCSINMLCVAVCMILLMKLGVLLAPALGMEEKGRMLGLVAALLYGLSTGAMATTLLIRMYGVVTCFCMLLLYIHVTKWLTGEYDRRNKGLIAVTVLGFWTQYFFLFYCLLLAAVTAVLLWCKKRGRLLACYVRSMIIAALIGVASFPFAVSDVFSSGRGVEALDNLASGLTGYGTRLASFGEILVGRTFGPFLWVILVILALVALGLVFVEKRTKKSEEGTAERASERSHLIAMLTIPVAGYFLLAARMSPYLVDRYIMPIFPLVILLGALLLGGVTRILEKEYKGRTATCIILGAALGSQLWGLIGYDGTYLYRGYEQQLELAQEYEESPCICVYDGVGYYENLLELAQYDKTLLLTLDELQNRSEKESISSLEQVIVLMKPAVDREQVIAVLNDQYHLTLESELLTDREAGDGLFLFVKAQE